MPDLKELLGRVLPDAWEGVEAPADAAIERGTRIRRRRRAASTVTLFGSFLVVALFASSMIATWRDDTSPAEPSTTFELPTLDPAEFYYWEFDGKTYDEKSTLLDPYSKALKDFLAEDGATPLNADGPVSFIRTGRQLVHDKAGDFVATSDDDKAVHWQPYFHSTFDTPSGESVFVDVIPRGGFTTGSTEDVTWESDGDYMGLGDAPTHLIACGVHAEHSGTSAEADVTAECEPTTGPDGQDVIRAIETRDETTGDTRYYGRVVLYRDDGTAVTVRVHSDQDESELPALLDAMTALAAALPTDPVR